MLADAALKNGIPEDTLLSVNIPALPLSEIKGIKITRQGAAGLRNFSKNAPISPTTYYWLRVAKTGARYRRRRGRSRHLPPICGGNAAASGFNPISFSRRTAIGFDLSPIKITTSENRLRILCNSATGRVLIPIYFSSTMLLVLLPFKGLIYHQTRRDQGVDL